MKRAKEQLGRPSPAAHGRRSAESCLLLVLSLLAGPAHGAGTEADRSAVLQAAFLHRFVGFVDWPETEPPRPFTVGVLGEDPFGDVLETVFADPQQTDGRILIARSGSPDSLLHCGLVYVALDDPEAVARALRILRTAPILTVSHRSGFASSGGHINFYFEDGRLRFEVNLDAVHAAGLRMSSRLLALARIVRTPGR